ncbi:hypothetical protein HOY80DRAFT_938341 [Tuber brumale]|nr:hypothetical protein HOY80DRAFT_938341 [Tuber brumale]
MWLRLWVCLLVLDFALVLLLCVGWGSWGFLRPLDLGYCCGVFCSGWLVVQGNFLIRHIIKFYQTRVGVSSG